MITTVTGSNLHEKIPFYGASALTGEWVYGISGLKSDPSLLKKLMELCTNKAYISKIEYENNP